jgi:hypothetical protein
MRTRLINQISRTPSYLSFLTKSFGSVRSSWVEVASGSRRTGSPQPETVEDGQKSVVGLAALEGAALVGKCLRQVEQTPRVGHIKDERKTCRFRRFPKRT